MINVAFFDVDGTLVYRDPQTGPGLVASERVRDALAAFSEAGGVPVLSTGRAPAGVEALCKQIDFKGRVCLDGALVVYGGQTIREACIAPAALERMVTEMLHYRIPAFIEGVAAQVELSFDGKSHYDWGDVVSDFESLLAYDPELRYCKVDLIDEAMPGYRKTAYLQEEFTYYDVGDGAHELALPGITKGTGALAFVEALRAVVADEIRTYAFGDSENDLALFEAADVAVAMGQASSHVRAAADYVSDTCANDGVATALEHLGLI